MGAKPKRRGKWGHYLKKGLELGALGAVQFVPGLDVVADAAVAGEAVEGAAVAGEAVEGAEASAGLLEKGMGYYNKASDYYDQANQYYGDFQEAQGYVNQMTSYRQPASLSYRGQPPQVAAAQWPAPSHYLGPMQKKILICGVIFLILLIIGALIARHFVRSCHGCSKSI
jgi:hypothetical protein